MKVETALSALLYLILAMSSAPAWASSEAGFDATFGSLRVRVLYSVAVDYDNGADTCIRNPSCLLYDVVEFFQAHFPEGYPRQEVLQFELYQSTKKEGNYLSLIRDPFEGGQFKSLYDGSANNDLGRQVTSLLKRYVKLHQAKKEPDGYVKLYKCIEKDVCNDIMFGAFPSEELRTGYCVLPGKGCDTKFVSVRRFEMVKIFSAIP